jgi:putative PIN family toxin of toxin-antitoxin system
LRIVLDTSVLARAALTAPNPSSLLVEVAALGRGAGLTLLYDGRILHEYRDVLVRPRFSRTERDLHRIRRLVRRLQWIGERVRVPIPPPAVITRDPKDAPFLEVALAGKAEVLVTFNPRDFRATPGFMVADPKDVLQALENRQREGR